MINGQSVECFSQNPFRIGLKPGESEDDILRIVIKGIPLSKGNDLITDFLKKNKVTLRKPLENARLRDKNKVLLNVYSGDRIAFVDKLAVPLPRKVKIGDTMALIYHKGQLLEKPLCTNCFSEGHFKKGCTKEAACMVCKESGHKAGDNAYAGKAKKPHKSVVAFQGYKDPLSNFFPVKDGIKVFGITAPTAEHAYQYSKAIQSGHDVIAKNILEAKTGKIAKDEASFLPFNPNWASMKEQVMKQVLTAKVKSCSQFKDSLIKVRIMCWQRQCVVTTSGQLDWIKSC